jgi:hypothetical protein
LDSGAVSAAAATQQWLKMQYLSASIPVLLRDIPRADSLRPARVRHRDPLLRSPPHLGRPRESLKAIWLPIKLCQERRRIAGAFGFSDIDREGEALLRRDLPASIASRRPSSSASTTSRRRSSSSSTTSRRRSSSSSTTSRRRSDAMITFHFNTRGLS